MHIWRAIEFPVRVLQRRGQNCLRGAVEMIVMKPKLLGDKNVKCDRELIRMCTINELWYLPQAMEGAK